jgi:hypothetical protein
MKSLMNDERLQDFAVLAIQEPRVWKSTGKVLTAPMGHSRWTRVVPTAWREGRWGIRSMLWVNRDLEAELVPVPSPYGSPRPGPDGVSRLGLYARAGT